jgi:hypothetical protein
VGSKILCLDFYIAFRNQEVNFVCLCFLKALNMHSCLDLFS